MSTMEVKLASESLTVSLGKKALIREAQILPVGRKTVLTGYQAGQAKEAREEAASRVGQPAKPSR